MAWQRVSPKVILKGFKECCIFNTVDETDNICCGMTVNRLGMWVHVRKMNALIVKVERVTLFC